MERGNFRGVSRVPGFPPFLPDTRIRRGMRDLVFGEPGSIGLDARHERKSSNPNLPAWMSQEVIGSMVIGSMGYFTYL